MSKKKDSLKPWLSRPAINRSVTLPLTRPLTQRLSNLNEFHPNELDPYLLFDTRDSMLGELESPALFLDSVPLLKNLADPSGATDAKQFTATSQPTALPLIDNEGYLFCSGVTGNSATIPHDSSLNLTDQLEVVARVKYRSYSGADAQCIVAKWASGDFNFRFSTAGHLEFFFKDSTNTSRSAASAYAVYNNNISDGDTIWVKMTVDATSTSTEVDFYTSKDNVKNEADVTWTALGTTRTVTTNGGFTSATNPVSFGAFDNSGNINDDLATGAVLKANYKAVIGSSPVLDVDFTSPNVRHGATKFECATGQVVTINQSGQNPASIIKKSVLRFDGVDDFMDGVFGQTVTGGYMFAAFSVLGDGGGSHGRVFSLNSTGSDDSSGGGAIFSLKQASSSQLRNIFNGAYKHTHIGLFDDANGDILHESLITDAAQLSRVNNADEASSSEVTTISAEEFNISARPAGTANAAIDLEYLALFPASITDEQADAVRNYINNRNNVFDLKDGFGYYFYNPQDLTSGAVTSWNGRIVGSDNGDTDKLATQTDANDQPVSDGYVVTFADNTDHLDIPSTTQAGWQVVGTSLGTFAYKVNANAVTELNLLGNLGNASYRKTGDLYGVILLPESATGKDIQEARKLLIDRGAADGATASDLSNFWRSRDDIVEFNFFDTSSGTSFYSTWRNCSSLTSFPLINTSSGTNFSYAWRICSSLTSFPLINTSSGTNFNQAWRNCSSLTSFPLINTSSGMTFNSTWYNCNSLTTFPSGFFDSWSPASLTTGVFNLTWNGCTALTAQSVENILTSIDSSGKYATSTGASGGTALADAGIDIDYNGDPLTAATTAAITSLKSKGWSIFINSVEQ